MSKPEKAAAYTTALIMLVFISLVLNYGVIGVWVFIILLIAALMALIIFAVLTEAYRIARAALTAIKEPKE